jgi:peroxiredoxin
MNSFQYCLLLFTFCASAPLFAQDGSQHVVPVAGSAEEVCPIKVGATVPKVVLRSVDGVVVNLAEEISKKPTVLIFYRGGWCVYCNRQMSQLREIERAVLDLGYQLIAISPDRPEKLRETIDKYEFSYTLLSDSKAEAIKAFGLAFRVSQQTLDRYKTIHIDLEDASGESHHVLPVPAAFIVGTDGVIKYSYVNPNYRVRIDPDVLLVAAKAALK